MAFHQDTVEDRTTYGTFEEDETSDKSSKLDLLGRMPYHTDKDPIDQRREESLKGSEQNSYTNESFSHGLGWEEQFYPPGISENGSTNLPIPEVEPEVAINAHKKRRSKKKKKSLTEVSTNGQLLKSSKVVPTGEEEGSFVQSQVHAPVYLQPSQALPPIQTKTAVAFAPTVVAAGSALPHIGQTSRPEPVGEEINEMKNAETGTTNGSFMKETSFLSQPEEKEKDEGILQHEKTKSTLHFKDGERHIDYVLAYEEDDDVDSEAKNQGCRATFEAGLEEAGLDLEREPKENSQNNKTCFVKVHVPWDILLKHAELMKMKLPLKNIKHNEEEVGEVDDMCECCHPVENCFHKCLDPCELHNPIIEEMFGDCDNHTTEFTREKIDYFDIKDEKTFFRTSERSRIANRILSKTKFGEKKIDIGIDLLLHDGAYCAAYPMHEGLYSSKEQSIPKDDNMRRMLYWEWARWGRWYKFQPLNLIRDYLSDKIALYFAFLQYYVVMLVVPSVVGISVFLYGCITVFDSITRHYLGDKIGLYFAWLGFYTNMLLIPTFVGLICFIYSIVTVWTYPPVQEVCDEDFATYAGNTTMCPLCDHTCSFWKLGTACLAVRITYVFDNSSTIFFAVFMSLWATMFLEFWKRQQFRLTYEWDLVDYDEERDLIRPEYEVLVERERLNPVTGRMEPFLDPKQRYYRTAFSMVTVLFWVAVIIAAVFAIIVYRLAISAVFAASVDLSSLGAIGSFATPSMLTTITASLISLLVIMALNKVYEKVAYALTKLELPRTQIEFDDSFTFKMFSFQFVNFYSYLFYVAFFKNSFSGYPENYNYLFGKWRWEECDAGGCMYELTLQLVIIMFGKQLWNNTLELILPWVINKYRQYKSKKATEEAPENEYTRWEQDFDLTPVHTMDLFHEYLEMVIQFGFVTLFVAAFPLAPVLALINNIVEIRLDANKFICEYRRPLAQKCSDIGAWYFLLEFIGTLSVVTNAFTIAITSDTIPKLVYYYIYSAETFGQSTYVGFTDNSLSVFNVSDFDQRSTPSNLQPFPGENITECRYRDYRSPPSADPKYTLTLEYWHIFAARLAFVIVMEHVVFFLKSFLDYLIPDRPKKLNERIKREHFLVQEMLFHAEKEKLMREYSRDSSRKNGTTPGKPTSVVIIENERATTPM